LLPRRFCPFHVKWSRASRERFQAVAFFRYAISDARSSGFFRPAKTICRGVDVRWRLGRGRLVRDWREERGATVDRRATV
jgi:hypothetical protein